MEPSEPHEVKDIKGEWLIFDEKIGKIQGEYCTKVDYKPNTTTEQIKSVTNCPTCGSEVDVHTEGETHYYVPKKR